MIIHVPPPAPRRKFFLHIAIQCGYAAGLIAVSVLLGMLGYHSIVHFTWIDSFLNACMLLGGMGPIGAMPNDTASKLFAGVFALYSGLIFLLSAALLLTPVFHRVLHYFHWEQSQLDKQK
jgi:hypothetical protein